MGGRTNFDLADYFPNGIFLTHIALKSSAANDILQVRDQTSTGAILCYIKDTTGGGVEREFNGTKRFPYIVYSECTFTTPASAVVIIEFR
jgi:hypothetical protein